MDFILREWRREDAADVARYADNEEIARNLRDVFPHPYTLADARGFVDICVTGDPEITLFRAIEADGHVIGSIALSRGSDVYQKTAELGYWLAEEHWGKGIMTEAYAEVLRFLFEEVGFHRIESSHAVQNPASGRVMEKCGLVYEGTFRKEFRLPSTGEWADIVHRAILKEDYFRGK